MLFEPMVNHLKTLALPLMRIFITGGTGFIGSHVVKDALSLGHEVVCLRRLAGSASRIDLDKQPLWLDRSFNTISPKDFQGIDVLLHLAAHSVQRPFDSLENCIKYNLIQPLSLFEKALSAGVVKFVVGGSCFEYGLSGLRHDFIPPNAPLEPTQSYSASKALASISFIQWALSKHVSLSIKRIFHVYGEGEDPSRLYPALTLAAKSGLDFPMSDGQQVRDFTNVTDVARFLNDECLYIYSNNNPSISTSNLGSGKPQTVLEFAQNIWSTTNAKGRLLPGLLEQRVGDVMRYVPELNSRHILFGN